MSGPPVPDLGYVPTVGESIKRAAQLYPEREFLVLPDERSTFADIERRARAVARALLAAGVGKGTRVGLFFTYGSEWVVAWLAASRVGALVMPFSTLCTPAELRTLLGLGDVALLVCPSRILGKEVTPFLEEAVPGLSGQPGPDLVLRDIPFLRAIWVTGGSDRRWATSIELDERAGSARIGEDVLEAAKDRVVPADLATVVYTSGSSAEPKGVVHTHGALVRTTALFGAGFAAANPVVFCAFPLFWIGGFLVLGGALHAGLKVCCVERFEAGPALDLIEREGCTMVAAWPSLIQSMRSHPTFAKRNLEQCPALASGPADRAVANSPVPGIPFHRGMSETVGNWHGVERRIVDPQSGRVLADREEGELVIRGYGVTQGYYKKEREEVFDEDGWLHTGDRCFMVDNRPYFVGRFYEMVKSQGANVSPREVELALEDLPEVAHAFVFGLPNGQRGEEVAAVVVPAPGTAPEGAALATALRRVLSPYKVPSRWEIVGSEQDVPWLGSGKPDKRALRARFE